VVISGPSCRNTNGGSNSPSRNFDPLVSSSSKALWLIVRSLLNSSTVSTVISGLDVLRLALVERARGHILSQNGNVSPGSRGPIGIIISLFGALISVSVSVVVLSGVYGGVSVQTSNLLSVGNEETLVSVSGSTSIVVHSVLVHSVSELSSGVGSRNSGISIGDSVRGGSISHSVSGGIILVGAHVLNNHVAINLGVLSATVLDGPFNRQQRRLIEAHCWSVAISSLCVVL